MCEFIRIININDNVSYIYDANINKVARLPEYVEDIDFKFDENFLYNNAALYEELLNKGFFKGKKLNKIDNPFTYKSDEMIRANLNRINLKVTNNCNLACNYCFFSEKYKHKKNDRFMSWEVAKKSIDYYIEHSYNMKSLSFHFYGGEPLLNFALIKKSVLYIESLKLNRKYGYYLTTNLTVISDEIVKFMVKYQFSVLVSLDGSKEVHDANRKSKSGEDTYELVAANLEYIKIRYPLFYSTLVFNAVLVKQEDYYKIKNYFLSNHLFSGNENEKMNKFMISPLYLGIDNQFGDSKKQLGSSKTRKFIDFLKDNLQRCRELVLSYLYGFNIIEVQSQFAELYSDVELVNWIRRFIDSISESTMSLEELGHPMGPCYAGSSRLMVDPDGDFWPCERVNTNNKQLCIGNIYTGIDIDKVKEMLNISKDYEACRTCWGFRYCGQCISAITNISREKACRNSLLYFEEKMKCYCNIFDINSQYENIEQEIGFSYDTILNFLTKENINIAEDELIYDPIKSSYTLYKVIIILKYKFGIKVKESDILKYRRLGLFLKDVWLRNSYVGC